MKKTYINPTMEVVKVNMQQQILAGSSFSKSGDFGGASGGSSGNGIVSADGHDDDFDW